MSDSREGSVDESKNDQSNESEEVPKRPPRRSVVRHWTSGKDVFQGFRRDEGTLPVAP